MLTAIIISLITCAAFIALIFIKPSVKIGGREISIYWAAPLAGAAVMTLSGTLGIGDIVSGLTADTEINPIKILILFLSMTLMSVYLDGAGFFRFIASAAISRAKSSQRALFMMLYLIVSVLTVFTSNDIVVLTFTPFICYFARSAKINPLPFLICEFIAANTWSMLLVIGNPTNIYLMTGTGISFAEYTRNMLLPTFLAGAASLAVLNLIFSKSLSKPMNQNSQIEKMQDKGAVLIGAVHLGICIIMMAFSGATGFPMWLIALFCFASLTVVSSVYLAVTKKGFGILASSFKRAPVEIVPFVLSMFVLVLALDKNGVTAELAKLLSGGNTVMKYGVTSFAAANIVNNIPMSVLFSAIIGNLEGASRVSALYSAVIGSNLGALLTPVGALAGIMWIRLLKSQNIEFSFAEFTAYGAAISIPALGAALIGLWIMM